MKIIVNKDRVRNLIIRIVRKLEIYGLYRVQVNFRDVDEKHTDITVALFMDKVMSSSDLHEIQTQVKNDLESLLGIEPFVVTIPYSEVKYHLREPKNM